MSDLLDSEKYGSTFSISFNDVDVLHCLSTFAKDLLTIIEFYFTNPCEPIHLQNIDTCASSFSYMIISHIKLYSNIPDIKVGTESSST